MSEIGRISGPLLKANLERHGVDLAFDTDLIYLSVTAADEETKNVGIGIRTDAPQRELHIGNDIISEHRKFQTTNLISENGAEIAKFYLDNKIQNLIDEIFIAPNSLLDPTVTTTRISTDNLKFSDKLIENFISDNDINLSANGLGKVTFTTNQVDVSGSLHSTGDITLDGNIIFGNSDTDNVTLDSDVASDIIPNIDDTYSLGTSSKIWNKLYSTNVNAEHINSDTLIVNGIDLLLTQGNIWYVSVNGSDTNTGDHLHDTFLTIKHALSQATAGDEILIFPGTYEEIFPLTIPQGVTVKGSGIRGVTIVPTAETNTESCFLLNGETTVELLTIKDFYSPGYAFELAPGYSSSTKSPYIYNVTVITEPVNNASVPADIYSDPLGLAGSYSSNSVAVDQINYTQSQVESWVGKLLMTWNGEGFPVTFYEITGVTDEPLDPGFVWRIVLDRDLENSGEEFYQFAIYPNDGLTSIVGTVGHTGSSDYSRSFPKSSLPPFFSTTVTEFWTCQIGEGLNIIDSVEEDPANSSWWKVNFKNIALPTVGIPIFTSFSGSVSLAGGGAYIDGGVADPATQLPPSALFFSTTFIVPNAKGIVATNGTRIEWLNSFTYFAETGILLETGTLGVGGSGNTVVTLGDVTGTISPGDTFTYYDQSGSVILATGTVYSVDGDTVTLDGYVGDLDLIDEITGSQFVAEGNARLTQANYKFETASLFLDGASYVRASDNIKFSLGSDDFCAEAWIYPTEFPTTESTVFAHWGATAEEQSFKVTITSTGGVKVYLNDGSSTELSTGIEYLLSESGDIITDETGDPIISEDETLLTDFWQHLAVVRYNDELSIYVSGVLKASVSLTPAVEINDGTGYFTFGYAASDTDYFVGYIDEFRLSRTVPIFTAEFTPPTTEYSTVDSTTAILMHFDGAESSTLFTNSSTPIQKIVLTSAVADRITALSYLDFASEMRSINSANVYGIYGAVADGRDTIGYLIGHNFGYIGTGLDSSNDRDLVIQANEVVEIDYGRIYYDSVDHKGDYRIGEIFYVNQETGDVVFNAEALNFLPSGNIILEGPSGSTTINAQYIQTGNLRIHDNNVDSLTGPINWSAFSGSTTLETDVNVSGNVDISGDFSVDGTIYLGNDVFDTITFNSNVSQTIVPDTSLLTIGESLKKWDTLYASLLNVDNVLEINSNTISILSSNTDLILDASGTGSVIVSDTNVSINNDLVIGTGLTVDGSTSLKATEINGLTTLVGNIDQTGDYDILGDVVAGNYSLSGLTSYFEIPDIKILNNEILVTATDTDFVLTANGTGGIKLDQYLKLTGTTLSNIYSSAVTNQEKSITFAPSGTGNVIIDSVKSLQIPVGNNLDRTLAVNGEIRFNDTFNRYEGFDRTGNVLLSGIFSQLRTTYITPELTIGANDNILRFAVNNTVRATVDSQKLTTSRLDIDNISISTNTINNASLTGDLTFDVSGTGSINVNDLSITEDTFENTLNNPLVIASTGTGYVKFNGDAIVIPYGYDADRRSSPETGELRNNIENPAQWTMEVFDGTTWIPAVGTSGAASQEDIEDTLNLYSLILG